MKKTFIAIALLMVSTLLPVRAQFMQMGLKLQYAGTSVDEIVSDVSYQVSDFSTDFLKGCELGLFLRFNVGRWISIQPEANFSMGSVWDEVEQADNFIDKVVTAFNNVQTINLSVPVLASLHLIEIEKLIGIRAFVGPEFYTSIKGASDEGVDFGTFSIVGGVSVDLLGFLNVDGRLVHNKGGNTFYKVGVGLLF